MNIASVKVLLYVALILKVIFLQSKVNMRSNSTFTVSDDQNNSYFDYQSIDLINLITNINYKKIAKMCVDAGQNETA